MNGGKIEISIAAVYSQFEADMKNAAAAAVPGGKAVGQGFANGFQSGSTGYMDRTINDIQGKLTKAVGAFTIVNSLGEALKAAAESGDWTRALEAGIKSVPVVGTFVGWGEALYDIINQTAAKAAAQQEVLGKQQRLNEINKAKIDAENRARAEADAYAEQEQKLADDAEKATQRALQKEYDLRKEFEAKQLEASGRMRESIIARSALKEAQILREMNDQIEGAKSEAEGLALTKIANQRIQNLRAETKIELEAKDKADAERRAKDAEERIKAEQKVLDAAYEKVKANDEKAAQIMADRLTGGAETGSVGTAFGTFKFGSYTDSEKKANDKTMVTKLDEIAKSTRATTEQLKRSGSGGFQ